MALGKGDADDYNAVKVTQTPQSSHSYQREARRRLKARSSDAQPLPRLQPLTGPLDSPIDMLDTHAQRHRDTHTHTQVHLELKEGVALSRGGLTDQR